MTASKEIIIRRNEKIWKQSMGYYLLNREKFNFSIKDLK